MGEIDTINTQDYLNKVCHEPLHARDVIDLCQAIELGRARIKDRDETIAALRAERDALREQVAGLVAALAPFVVDWGEDEQTLFRTQPLDLRVYRDVTVAMMLNAYAALSAAPRAGDGGRDATTAPAASEARNTVIETARAARSAKNAKTYAQALESLWSAVDALTDTDAASEQEGES